MHCFALTKPDSSGNPTVCDGFSALEKRGVAAYSRTTQTQVLQDLIFKKNVR